MNPKFISVIIPVEPDGSATKVFDSLKKVNYPKDYLEVIVVEGMQPSRQRNEAVKNSKGEIIYFFDSDSQPTSELFNCIIDFYNRPETAVVGGPVICPSTAPFIQKVFDAILGSFFGSFSTRARYKSVGKIRETTEKELILANMSFRKNVFDDIAGFNENLYPNEENELLNRIKSKGYKIIYNPDAYIYRRQRQNISEFIKQAFRYGRGRMEQVLEYPCYSDVVHFVPTLFVFYLLSLFLYNQFLYLIPLFIYIIIDFFESIWLTIKSRNIAYMLFLPVLFLLRHIMYGIGIVFGLFARTKKSAKIINSEIGIKIYSGIELKTNL